DQPPLRVLRHQMAAAGLTPLAEAVGALVESPDPLGPLADLHALRVPQRERVDGTGAPLPAGAAVAVAHPGRLTTDRDLDRAAKALPSIRLRLTRWLTHFPLLSLPIGTKKKLRQTAIVGPRRIRHTAVVIRPTGKKA